MKTAWALGFGACFSIGASACGSPPEATSDRSAAIASSAPTASTAAPAPASSSAPAADPCVDARKAIVTHAATLAECKADADCKVHPTSLCDFVELDCYAAHVNKDRSTAELDEAVRAFTKSCPVSKCKCEIPSKSVCKSGKCTAG